MSGDGGGGVPYASRTARIVNRLHTCDLGNVESAQLLVMGDLHLGDAHTDEDMIRAGVKWLTAEPNRWAVIAGDILNAGLKSSVSDVYSEAYTVGDAKKAFARIVAPARERIIAVVSGNHDHRVYKETGDDAAEDACFRAGVPYFGGEAFLRLMVGHHEGKGQAVRSPIAYTGYMTHGFGGGRMVGGKANNLLRLRDIVAADWYASGHTHTPVVLPQVTWECDANHGNVIEREQMFVATGASLDRGNGYAVRFGFPALAKCWPVITFDGRRKHMSATVG